MLTKHFRSELFDDSNIVSFLLNNSMLGDSLDRNYSRIEHEINDITNTCTGSVSYLDIHLNISTDIRLSSYLDIHLNISTDIRLRTKMCPSFYYDFGLRLWYYQTFLSFFLYNQEKHF